MSIDTRVVVEDATDMRILHGLGSRIARARSNGMRLPDARSVRILAGSVVACARILGALLITVLIGPGALGWQSEDLPIEIQAGFSGVRKLGHVCPIRVRLGEGIAPNARAVRALSVDGDGVPVTYRKDLTGQGNREIWLPIKIGRRDHAVKVEVLGAAENILAAAELSSDRELTLDSDQPLVLAIGSSMGLEELSRKVAGGSSSNFTVLTIDDASKLPETARELSSVDLIVISSDDLDLLRSIGSRWQAIEAWISAGGGCVFSASPQLANLSLPESGAAVVADASDNGQSREMADPESLSVFAKLLPGKILARGEVTDPRAIESLVSTEDPMGQFEALVMEPSRGEVELMLEDSVGRKVPWWIRYAHGQGTIQFVASSLDNSAFEQWDDRRLLWSEFVSAYFDKAVLEGVTETTQNTDSSYLGYNDLVGQLRATMDVFAGIQVVSFGQVAAILVGVLLLVGPLDYLISVKWLQRPDFSWYFSTVVLVAISAALTWYCSTLRPGGVLVNSVQVIDFDAVGKQEAGTLWTHVYSGEARQVDVSATSNVDGLPVFLDWQGLPGGGLGGLDAQLSTDRGMPAYEIDVVGTDESSIRAIGLAASGTKCLSGSWRRDSQYEFSSNLSELRGVDQLQGEFTNPFEVDIRDPILFYHNWFYRLNSRIPAGASVTISRDTLPKDVTRKLNERRAVNQKVTVTRWDPADRNSVDRLLEVMMFYKAANGRNYTSLNHRYQPHLDHSNLLDTNRALLVGRLEDPIVSVEISGESGELKAEQKMNRVWFRLSMPVEAPATQN